MRTLNPLKRRRERQALQRQDEAFRAERIKLQEKRDNDPLFDWSRIVLCPGCWMEMPHKTRSGIRQEICVGCSRPPYRRALNEKDNR